MGDDCWTFPDPRVMGVLNVTRAAALLAAARGAAILRVHDVGPSVDALRVLTALGGGTLAR